MPEVVKLLTELGPNIDIIARKTGVFKETVRYWYKAKILGKGMAVQAVPNEAALGMKRGLPSFFGSLALLNLHESCRL